MAQSFMGIDLTVGYDTPTELGSTGIYYTLSTGAFGGFVTSSGREPQADGSFALASSTSASAQDGFTVTFSAPVDFLITYGTVGGGA